MLSPFLVSSLKISYPLSPPPAHQSTHSHFLNLAFPYTGAQNLHRTKVLFSHWWPTRPSSATYASRGMSATMCFLWLVVYSQGVLGVLVSSYCCFSYGAANPFSSLGPFSSSSIGDQSNGYLWASTSVFVWHWQSLSGDSYIRLVSASTCWDPQ